MCYFHVTDYIFNLAGMNTVHEAPASTLTNVITDSLSQHLYCRMDHYFHVIEIYLTCLV
jgi:hypothetical protein